MCTCVVVSDFILHWRHGQTDIMPMHRMSVHDNPLPAMRKQTKVRISVHDTVRDVDNSGRGYESHTNELATAMEQSASWWETCLPYLLYLFIS